MRDNYLTELLGIQGWYVKNKEIVNKRGRKAVKELDKGAINKAQKDREDE
ncbi:MAG: hypothetical protein ACUVTN_12340 [Thermodesulfobacteriota bacterium]